MEKYFQKYLNDIDFPKQLKKLEKKLKGKSIIIYGAGTMFQYIVNNYSLEKLNIIGISDLRFTSENNGQKLMGYNMITKTCIKEYNPDYVLIATENYTRLTEEMGHYLKDTNIRLLPLAKQNLKYILSICEFI